MFEKAKHFFGDERGAVTTERIKPGEYRIGEVVELLQNDPAVAKAVTEYKQLQYDIAVGNTTAEDSDLVRKAEQKLTDAIADRGITLTSEHSATGLNDTIPTFATAFEQILKEQLAASADVVEFPAQQGSEAATNDLDRREAA